MEEDAKRARAVRKVEKIKKFHNHLKAYLVVNIGILFLKFTGLGFVVNGIENPSEGFLRWIDWNIFGIPIIWGLFVLFHAARAYGWIPFLGAKWEERKIRQFMEEDTED